MTQQDKELLLKDLCARLPYGVIVETPKGKGHVCDINLTIFGTKVGVNINPTIRDVFDIEDIQLYLFPISSMTEEQKEEWRGIRWSKLPWEELDWLNKGQWDYRHLIEKGLVIDATNLNIY